MWGLFITAITFFVRLHWDLNTSFHDGKNFSHWKRNLAISPFCVIAIWQFSLYLEINLIPAIIVSSFLFCSNWLYWFSGVFNKKRNLKWWFLGNQTGGNAAWTDRILRRLKPNQHRILVTGLMVLSILIYTAVKIYSNYK